MFEQLPIESAEFDLHKARLGLAPYEQGTASADAALHAVPSLKLRAELLERPPLPFSEQVAQTGGLLIELRSSGIR